MHCSLVSVSFPSISGKLAAPPFRLLMEPYSVTFQKAKSSERCWFLPYLFNPEDESWFLRNVGSCPPVELIRKVYFVKTFIEKVPSTGSCSSGLYFIQNIIQV
jgi:hypothetical protein